jgi:CubicO group peptidase (beta-lactamase class C family)
MKKLISWFYSSKPLLLLIIFTVFSVQSEENNDYPIPERIQKIEQFLTESEKNGFSGAILVSYKGKVLLKDAFGYADQKAKIPATTDMVYDTGSLTKQFTAAGVLQLIKEGKLSTNDTLSQFFDNLPEDKKKITLHQLLTHSSGIRSYSRCKGDFDCIDIETDEFFRKTFSRKLKFEPGSKYEYENVGYSILGRIIELVSNEDYEVFINRVFFKPLGMTQTGYLLPDWDPSLYPKAYFLGKKEDVTNIPKYQEAGRISWTLKGNGGIYSTVSDMHKWMSALANYEVLTEELINLLTDKHVRENASGNSFYGYGWSVYYGRTSHTKYVNHNGSNAFFYADILWKQNEEQLQVIMLSNMYFKNMARVPSKIVNIWNSPEYSPDEFKMSIWGPLVKFTWPVSKWPISWFL